MPFCKNDPKRKYKGDEPSPKGLGWCAHGEKEGKVRKGLDGNKWVVKKVSSGSLRWVKQSNNKSNIKQFSIKNNKIDLNPNKQLKYSDLIFHITFIPYFIYDGNKTIRFGNNKLTKYIIDKKLPLMKKIVKNILWNCNIKKYVFNKKTNLIELDISIYKHLGELHTSQKYNINFLQNIIINEMNTLYGNSKNLIGDLGPDTWMGGDIVILQENEYNNITYEFGIAYKKIRW